MRLAELVTRPRLEVLTAKGAQVRDPGSRVISVSGVYQEKRRLYSLGTALNGFSFDAAQRTREAVDSTPD